MGLLHLLTSPDCPVHQRRFRRWLSNRRVDVNGLYTPVIQQALVKWGSQHRLYLSLDTTLVWNQFCIVWLGVVYRGRTVPMAWSIQTQASSSVRLRVGDSPKCDVAIQPKFKVGDVVKVRNPLPVEHCKLPGYLRTKKGVVDEVYEGAYNYYFPTGDGVGDPMPIYNVKFDSHDIWGNLTEPQTWIYVQIFEAYLEDPA